MSKALLQEFCRVSGLSLKPEFFRRCQREFREQILPLFDAYDQIVAENAALKAQIEKRAKKDVAA